MRLRLFLVIIGALLVIATYTFPLWQPYFQNVVIFTADEAFPGLATQYQSDFLRLPPDQQRAYFELAEENRELAVQMVTAALQPGSPAPEADADIPTLNSPITAARGVFAQIDAIHWAQGTVTIYQGADDRKILRFENFNVANGSDLRVVLSAAAEPETPQDMRLNGVEFDAGSLRGTYGDQNYELPVELDLTQYGSIVIYSPGLDMIYSIAPLIIFV